MAFNLDNTQTEIQYRIADAKVPTYNPLLSPESLASAVRASLITISRDMTLHMLSEFAGQNLSYYQLDTVCPGWSENFSSIEEVTYPAVAAFTGTTDYPVKLMPDLDWKIEPALVSSVRTLFLYMCKHIPKPTELVRVSYTGLHQLAGLDGAVVTTIQPAFETAFYDLAASNALTIVAADMARKDQPTISADHVNFDTTVKNIRGLASDYLDRYRLSLSASRKDGSPAAQDQFLHWNTGMQYGYSWLFHNPFPYYTPRNY